MWTYSQSKFLVNFKSNRVWLALIFAIFVRVSEQNPWGSHFTLERTTLLRALGKLNLVIAQFLERRGFYVYLLNRFYFVLFNFRF